MAKSSDRRPIDPEVLDRLDRSTTDILTELRTLRGALARRPTRNESRVRVRLAVILLALGIFGAIQIHDSHVEYCSPGARSANGIEYIAESSPKDFRYSELQERFNEPLPEACDITFPTHAHSPGEEWPTEKNLGGLAIYFVLLLLAFIWLLTPMGHHHQEKKVEGRIEDDRLSRVRTEQQRRRRR